MILEFFCCAVASFIKVRRVVFISIGISWDKFSKFCCVVVTMKRDFNELERRGFFKVFL